MKSLIAFHMLQMAAAPHVPQALLSLNFLHVKFKIKTADNTTLLAQLVSVASKDIVWTIEADVNMLINSVLPSTPMEFA